MSLFSYLRDDLHMVFERDPAARSKLEVILCYPGLHAVWLFRLSHWLWKRRLKLLARILAYVTRFYTGIEIHPGATIGRRFFIDHGHGVVIGETAELGDDVTLYQGVTLGGTSWNKGKRHPTIEERVVVGANAVVLGDIVIGHDSRIGSSSVVVKTVPPHSTVVGIPGKVVHSSAPMVEHCAEGERVNLQHGTLPDPFEAAISGLLKRVEKLEQEIKHERRT